MHKLKKKVNLHKLRTIRVTELIFSLWIRFDFCFGTFYVSGTFSRNLRQLFKYLNLRSFLNIWKFARYLKFTDLHATFRVNVTLQLTYVLFRALVGRILPFRRLFRFRCIILFLFAHFSQYSWIGRRWWRLLANGFFHGGSESLIKQLFCLVFNCSWHFRRKKNIFNQHKSYYSSLYTFYVKMRSLNNLLGILVQKNYLQNWTRVLSRPAKVKLIISLKSR